MSNYYIGLDPSMSHFGVTVIDTEHKIVLLDDLTADNHHDFVLMCWAIANLYNKFCDRYSYYVNKETTYYAQEAPISAGINAGKLNALGEHFYINLGAKSKYERIRTYHPMKLKSFHHKKGYKKKDTIDVVTSILEYMEKEGYSIKIVVSRTKKDLTITDGEADSFMYAIRTYLVYNNDKISKYILDKYPRFSVIQSIEEINYGKR